MRQEITRRKCDHCGETKDWGQYSLAEPFVGWITVEEVLYAEDIESDDHCDRKCAIAALKIKEASR
jgi:hypothetical protein